MLKVKSVIAQKDLARINPAATVATDAAPAVMGLVVKGSEDQASIGAAETERVT